MYYAYSSYDYESGILIKFTTNGSLLWTFVNEDYSFFFTPAIHSASSVVFVAGLDYGESEYDIPAFIPVQTSNGNPLTSYEYNYEDGFTYNCIQNF